MESSIRIQHGAFSVLRFPFLPLCSRILFNRTLMPTRSTFAFPGVVNVTAALLIFFLSATVYADDSDTEFFEKEIRPALVMYCYECHSADSKKLGGQLLLDTRSGVLTGGDSGPAIVVGKADESLLIKAVRYTDDSVKMPPKSKLPDSVIADFETWVNRGATDPRDIPGRPKSTVPWDQVMRQRSDWWSLRPVTTPAVPEIKEAVESRSPVDRFVAAKLNEHGLAPGESTDARTLARRLSLVLTGLPPTIEQVDRFVADCRSGSPLESLPQPAVEKYVDSLLQSSHFGEQWARHWLDVVRFSETHGNEWNYEVHHAWRYRDYLVRAFNSDVPYNQFICEHLAGDLMPNPRINQNEQFNESVIGTGFFRFGEVNHDDCISLRSLGYDLADNQIDTLTKAFQATTVACARCHNHKLDAVSMEDYYAMLAVLRSSRNVSHSIDSPEVNAAAKQRLRELKTELRQELGKIWQGESAEFVKYMRAAHAVRANRPNVAELTAGLNPARLEKWVATLTTEKQPFEDPFDAWRRMSDVETPAALDPPADALNVSPSMPQIWQGLSDLYTKESAERAEFNRTRFVPFADFRTRDVPGWQAGGQALQDDVSQSGDFVLQTDGDSIVQTILPAGRFTQAISSKQNGTLRSPVLAAGKKYISFQVMGQRSSALRLVSNNCQLNYANYRALISPDLIWVTFSPPDDRESLRTYAELMTMFDNPKFPDQLAPLGGDPGNYKMPWDKAAENPRSYFGVTHAVLHDGPETPKPTVSHLAALYDGPTPTIDELAARCAARATAAINAWISNTATDDDVRWTDSLIRRGLIENSVAQSESCRKSLQEYRTIESSLSVPRVSVGLADGGPGIEQPIFVRGDCFKPGELVPRRYLEVLSTMNQSGRTGNDPQARVVAPFTSSGSGRLELAGQIASSTNPLTARVMVNRVWHHLFGTGIVRTVDDFGHVGDLPSHPELLDYLSNQFVSEGWSVKRLIRSLVLTRTFQATNHVSPSSREVDPQNRLLQHYPARRMEAESVRDSILAASGRLDESLYGPSIQPYRDKEYADRRLFPGPLDGNGRRSVYIKNNLMEAPKFLGAFNFPGGKVAQGRRDVTNVPAQALALLNDPFVLQQAEVWSLKLMANSSDSMATRIDTMFRSAIGRSPTAEELSRFETAIAQLAEIYQVPVDGVMTNAAVWKDVAHSIFNLSEMIYIP